jgi:hypothetical protein
VKGLLEFISLVFIVMGFYFLAIGWEWKAFWGWILILIGFCLYVAIWEDKDDNPS